jgi:hypothetical protein
MAGAAQQKQKVTADYVSYRFSAIILRVLEQD